MSKATDADTGTSRTDDLINNYLDIRLQAWREVNVYDELGTFFKRGGLNRFVRFMFGQWNARHEPIVKRNTETIEEGVDFTVDRVNGVVTLGEVWSVGERLHATYNFNYFPNDDLANLIFYALRIINSMGVPQTSYTRITDAPVGWDGLIGEIAYLEALRKIRLDSTLWRSAVLMRHDQNSLSETLSLISEEISACQERISSMIEGAKHLKHVSKPTINYYLSTWGGTGFGGIGSDGVGTGKLRGFRSNRLSGW